LDNAGLATNLYSRLGAEAVCTNPTTCSSTVSAPVPLDASCHYALGHRGEDDPTCGDGTFSSAYAFGFYPWIDADSMGCDRPIHKA
jgi:hypothetical protein